MSEYRYSSLRHWVTLNVASELEQSEALSFRIVAFVAQTTFNEPSVGSR